MISTEPGMVAVAVLAAAVARRRPELRPLALGCAVLAVLDLALLVTGTSCPRFALAVFVAWPGVVAAPAWAMVGRKSEAPGAIGAPGPLRRKAAAARLENFALVLVGFGVVGLVLGVAYPHLGAWYLPALRMPRLAAVLVTATACLRWRRQRRGLMSAEAAALVLPVCHAAHLAVGAWAYPAPWASWYLARAAAWVSFAALGVALARCRSRG